jgi:hypothetical protein
MPSPSYGEPEYLCYEVIKQVREQLGADHDLPKTTFNKLCYIADRELRDEENIDVGLPVHWYIYGGVLTDDATNGFYESVPTRWDENRGRNVVLTEDVSSEDFNVTSDIKNLIRNRVREVIAKFGKHYTISVPQDYQYQNYAPTPFIQVFHEFRGFVEDLDEDDTVDSERFVSSVEVNFSDIVSEPTEERDTKEPSEETNDQIREYLDELLRMYPEDTYTRMEDEFLDWENLTWQMAKNGFYSQLNDFMDEFWTVFSRVELRIAHNQNVPLRIRSQWNQQVDEQIEKFCNEINRRRDVILETRQETDSLGPVSESYGDTVRDLFEDPIQ